MHAFVIIATSKRQQKAQEFAPLDLTKEQPDLLQIDPDKSIGIDQIRQIKTFLSRPPLNESHKVVWIPRADTMTEAAQNAILKSLEEPPPFAQIILASSSTSKLLPTIISRCQVISSTTTDHQKSSDLDKVEKFIKHFPSATTSQKIQLVERLLKAESPPITWCTQLQLLLRKKLKNKPSKTLHTDLELLQKTLYRLEKNANPQLTLEHLFLNLKLH